MTTLLEYCELIDTTTRYYCQERTRLNYEFRDKITSLVQGALNEGALQDYKNVDPELLADFALRLVSVESLYVSEKDAKSLEHLIKTNLASIPVNIEKALTKDGWIYKFSFLP